MRLHDRGHGLCERRRRLAVSSVPSLLQSMNLVTYSASRSTECSSTAAPASRCAGSVCSRTLWLSPPTLGTKIIVAGQSRAIICASWAGPARNPPAGESKLARRRLDERHHLGRKGDRRETREAARRDCDLLLCGETVEKAGELALGVLQQGVVGIAQVDRQHRPLRDHIDEIGVKLDA